MERYVYARPVLRAEGYQYFYVDAESREDADRRIKKEGEFRGEEVEVVSLGPTEFVDVEPVPEPVEKPSALETWMHRMAASNTESNTQKKEGE